MLELVKIKSVKKLNRKEQMVDITVEKNHNFFLANGILSKNSEVNTYRLADNFIFKMIGLMQMERERTRRDPLFIFLDFLRPMNVEETLFMSSDLTKIFLAKTPLPTFWTDELSVPARRIDMKEAIETCKKLYEKGLKPERISFRMDLLGWDWSPEDCLHYAAISKKSMKDIT